MDLDGDRLTQYDGPFTYGEAMRAGLSAGAIAYRVEKGIWRRLSRGVFVDAARFRMADPRDQHLLKVRAALINAPAGAVISHDSAVLLHEIETIDGRIPRLPHLTAELPRSRRPPGRRGYVLRRATLPDCDIWPDPYCPVTSPARTVVDVARSLPMEASVIIADSALRRRLCSLAELEAAYFACRTWPGALAAGQAVYFADPRAESPLESFVRVGLHREGLPPPQTQVTIDVGRHRYRPDFYWKEARTIGEADGFLKYTDLQALREEKLREERLRDMGLEVVRVTWAQMRDEPAATAERFRRAFERGLHRR
jgi:very-short-patch-repair endonuclease